MIWLITILTVLLVIDCLLLMLLVLVQLPKKEAGLGQAFGGGTTEALFGAGSGNALTKMTKYTAGIFFILTLIVSMLSVQLSRSKKSSLERNIQKVSAEADPISVPSTPATPTGAPAPAPDAATKPLLTTTTTNVGSAPVETTPPAEKPK